MDGPSSSLAFHYVAANQLPGNTVDSYAIYKLEALVHGEIPYAAYFMLKKHGKIAIGMGRTYHRYRQGSGLFPY